MMGYHGSLSLVRVIQSPPVGAVVKMKGIATAFVVGIAVTPD